MGRMLGINVVRYRWWIIGATLAAVLLAAYGTRFLVFNDETRIWFSKENPQLQAFEELERTYTKSDNIFFALAPADGNVFTRPALSAVEWLTRRAWQIPYSNRVDSISNFQYSHARNDEFVVHDLVENAAQLTDAELARIREIALQEQELVHRLLADDAAMTGININIIRPSESPDELANITAHAEKLRDEFSNRYPDITIYLSGGIAFDDAFVDATRHDLVSLVPAMLCVMMIFMFILLRSLACATGILLVIGLSTLMAMGLAGWTGITLNPATGTAPTVILTLAIADSVHILITMLRRMRQGDQRHDAIIYSLTANLRPVFITSVTTAIGFLSMNFSDAPPFHDLGNLVAMGVTLAFILSVTFLPALMAVLPLKATASPGVENWNYHRLAGFVIRWRKPVVITSLAVSALMTTGLLRIELDDNFIEYLSESFEVRRASDIIQEKLTGFDVIEYSVKAAGPDGISAPVYLERLEAFANWYRSQPGVVHISVLTDVVKRLNRNMHDDDDSYYRLPQHRDLTAQYLLLYEMSLPYGLDLNDRISVDKSSSRMRVILRHMSSRDIREIDARARNWLQANAPSYMYAHGTGLSVMFAHISEVNINSMLFASIMALLLISMTLIFALRSLKLGLISLVPNLLPAFIMFSIWGLLVGQVGLAASVIVALTLGIVVDDTVHFLSNYLHARRTYKASPAEAVQHAFARVGTALWVTTFILTIGFSILALSDYQVNEQMGMLTVLTITIALALDFIVLPALLVLLEPHPEKTTAMS